MAKKPQIKHNFKLLININKYNLITKIEKKKLKSQKKKYLRCHLKDMVRLLAKNPTRLGLGQTMTEPEPEPLRSDNETATGPLISSQQPTTMEFC